jgi:hypothetical protein
MPSKQTCASEAVAKPVTEVPSGALSEAEEVVEAGELRT